MVKISTILFFSCKHCENVLIRIIFQTLNLLHLEFKIAHSDKSKFTYINFYYLYLLLLSISFIIRANFIIQFVNGNNRANINPCNKIFESLFFFNSFRERVSIIEVRL